MVYPTTSAKAAHPGWGLFWFSLVTLALVVLVVALLGPQPNTTGSRPQPRPAVVSDHATLDRDATLTQGLGNTTSDPASLSPGAQQQLQHASDPAFLGELEQHQAEIDRMLAQGQP